MYQHSTIATPMNMTTGQHFLPRQYAYTMTPSTSTFNIPPTQYAHQFYNTELSNNFMIQSSSDMYEQQHSNWNGFDNVSNICYPPMATVPQESEYQTMTQGKCAVCFGMYPIYFMDQNLCFDCWSYTQHYFNESAGNSINEYLSPLSCESASPCSSNSTAPSTPLPPSPPSNGNQKQRKPPKKTVCTNCKTEESTMWRRGLTGNRLCNPCGLHLKNHKTDRPSHLFAKPIQKRKRHSKVAISSQDASIGFVPLSMNHQ